MSFDYTKQPGLKVWNKPLKTNGRPLISIITAYYNAGKYFEQTYNCVMNQTFPWFEWIIVDDGSTDEASLELLSKLSDSDARIRVIHQENGGASLARNTGVMAAGTDYIFPLDSDDLIEPTCLEYEYWALQFNPSATWSYTDSVGFQGEEYLWEIPFDPERMKKENHLAITALIRKEMMIKVGIYSQKDIPFDEDWHFWLKLLAKGCYPVQIRGEHLFWYRRTTCGVYGSVHNDPVVEKKALKIIKDEASFVINPKPPVYYPVTSWKNYEALRISHWTDCVYETHKKIHVLFLLPWLVMGGADKFNLDLIAGLDKDKYEISIITTQKSDNTWLQQFREVTLEIFNLPNFLSPNDYPEFIDYFIRSREIDVLFQSNSTDGYYLLPWLRKNHPALAIVDYVHMEEWYWRNGGHARSSGVMGNILERTYVCNSATRDVMIEYFHRDPDDIETVHIGIDEKQFDSTRVQEGILYEELQISKERPIVLFICRLHPQKRPFLMLKIAQYVKTKISNVVFAVIGDGPLEEELMQTSVSMGLDHTVYFLGAKAEVRPYYRDAKVTLICSVKEGLALTAYESCAMGVPVVSADVGGEKDLVDDSVGALIPFLEDEASGFESREFSSEEIESYGNAVVTLLTDEKYWKMLSVNCRRKIENAFTIDAMIEYFNKEFERLIKDRNLSEKRMHISMALQELGALAEELYITNLVAENMIEAWPRNEPHVEKHYMGNSQILARLEECEKVLERHEEVVNRHEKSINHQWENQKWHEKRIQVLEKSHWLKRAILKIKNWNHAE